MTSDLEFAWENAWSFSEKNRPSGMEYIGTVTKGGRDYLFYKDISNKFWYESRKSRIKN